MGKDENAWKLTIINYVFKTFFLIITSSLKLDTEYEILGTFKDYYFIKMLLKILLLFIFVYHKL